MQHLEIQIVNSSEEAVNYNTEEHKRGPAHIEKAIIVRKGMESGKDTVDLQIVADEKKYVALITGNLLKSLATLINITEPLNAHNFVYTLPDDYTLSENTRKKLDTLVHRTGINNAEAQAFIDINIELMEKYAKELCDAVAN